MLHIRYNNQVPETSCEPKLFGDLLALARHSWVLEMAQRLEGLGYRDYRRSDAIILRWLRHGPMPLSQLDHALGVSRQAARKLVDGLVVREFADVERDRGDARRLNVALTANGREYARNVLDVVTELNRELEGKLDPYDVVVAKAVLRTVSNLYGSE
jgi:DNA-binding MarR family transcriptional regulator